MTNIGIVKIGSNHSVDETLANLQSALAQKSIHVFGLVDHSGEAKKAGLEMPPTKLLIFGNPRGGTPLMLAAPSIALDLPLKILISQDTDGRVWISYNSSDYLCDRHGLPENLLQNIAFLETLVAGIAK